LIEKRRERCESTCRKSSRDEPSLPEGKHRIGDGLQDRTNAEGEAEEHVDWKHSTDCDGDREYSRSNEAESVAKEEKVIREDEVEH
jgi:hypothetical protein